MQKVKSVKVTRKVKLVKQKFCIKNIAGRIPETTRIVVQNNLYPNLDKIRISKKTLEITKIVDQYNIKSVKIFSGAGSCWWDVGKVGGG